VEWLKVKALSSTPGTTKKKKKKKRSSQASGGTGARNWKASGNHNSYFIYHALSISGTMWSHVYLISLHVCSFLCLSMLLTGKGHQIHFKSPEIMVQAPNGNKLDLYPNFQKKEFDWFILGHVFPHIRFN
jgi:hypothetical protein